MYFTKYLGVVLFLLSQASLWKSSNASSASQSQEMVEALNLSPGCFLIYQIENIADFRETPKENLQSVELCVHLVKTSIFHLQLLIF